MLYSHKPPCTLPWNRKGFLFPHSLRKETSCILPPSESISRCKTFRALDHVSLHGKSTWNARPGICPWLMAGRNILACLAKRGRLRRGCQKKNKRTFFHYFFYSLTQPLGRVSHRIAMSVYI